jgi:hypothetical protein
MEQINHEKYPQIKPLLQIVNANLGGARPNTILTEERFNATMDHTEIGVATMVQCIRTRNHANYGLQTISRGKSRHLILRLQAIPGVGVGGQYTEQEECCSAYSSELSQSFRNI